MLCLQMSQQSEEASTTRGTVIGKRSAHDFSLTSYEIGKNFIFNTTVSVQGTIAEAMRIDGASGPSSGKEGIVLARQVLETANLMQQDILH